MQNDYVPIDHSTGSAVASTTSGAATGALKGGLKVGAGWLATTAGIGAAVVLALTTGGASLLGSGALWAIIGGGAAGAAFGLWSLPVVAGIGALFGGVKGASRASDEVKMERGAAVQLQAQVQAYQAMAAAQARGNQYGNFPPQGSAMNPAMASIQANTAQDFGPITGQQLQRA